MNSVKHTFLTRSVRSTIDAMKIVAAKKILKANDQLAAENRARLDAAGVFGVNVVGSPGSGKTTLLEALFAHLKGRLRPAVIEGDIAGSIDADRMEKIGVPVVQINTDGACHLDANMIATANKELDFAAVDLLAIENVGNLVCTAGFDLGEHLRIVVLSTSEGDDKAVKYPAIFQGSHALFITKTDLLAIPELQHRADHGRHAAARARGPGVSSVGRSRRRHPRSCRLAGEKSGNEPQVKMDGTFLMNNEMRKTVWARLVGIAFLASVFAVTQLDAQLPIIEPALPRFTETTAKGERRTVGPRDLSAPEIQLYQRFQRTDAPDEVFAFLEATVGSSDHQLTEIIVRGNEAELRFYLDDCPIRYFHRKLPGEE